MACRTRPAVQGRRGPRPCRCAGQEGQRLAEPLRPGSSSLRPGGRRARRGRASASCGGRAGRGGRDLSSSSPARCVELLARGLSLRRPPSIIASGLAEPPRRPRPPATPRPAGPRACALGLLPPCDRTARRATAPAKATATRRAATSAEPRPGRRPQPGPSGHRRFRVRCRLLIWSAREDVRNLDRRSAPLAPYQSPGRATAPSDVGPRSRTPDRRTTRPSPALRAPAISGDPSSGPSPVRNGLDGDRPAPK